jgi:phage tail-like protein
MGLHFPYTNYHFSVSFLFPVLKFNAGFQSVDGLSFSSEGAELIEGGNPGFKHKLTDQGTYGKLELKRGFTPDKGLFHWCQETHDTMTTTPCNILVSLLDKEGMPVKNWLVFNAIPRGWTAGGFDVSSSNIMVEAVSFSYQHFILI